MTERIKSAEENERAVIIPKAVIATRESLSLRDLSRQIQNRTQDAIIGQRFENPDTSGEIDSSETLVERFNSRETDPRLARFHEQYEQLDSSMKERRGWAKIKRRLMVFENAFLSRALNLRGQGVLFGIDGQGNPLIADNGDELLHRGKTYKNAREEVVFKRLKRGCAPLHTWYELFKPEEVEMFEKTTGRLFAGEIQGENWSGSWLKHGEVAKSDQNTGKTIIANKEREGENPLIGVRRLLRVIKLPPFSGRFGQMTKYDW